jgi:hypothetical protein
MAEGDGPAAPAELQHARRLAGPAAPFSSPSRQAR